MEIAVRKDVTEIRMRRGAVHCTYAGYRIGSFKSVAILLVALVSTLLSVSVANAFTDRPEPNWKTWSEDPPNSGNTSCSGSCHSINEEPSLRLPTSRTGASDADSVNVRLNTTASSYSWSWRPSGGSEANFELESPGRSYDLPLGPGPTTTFDYCIAQNPGAVDGAQVREFACGTLAVNREELPIAMEVNPPTFTEFPSDFSLTADGDSRAVVVTTSFTGDRDIRISISNSDTDVVTVLDGALAFLFIPGQRSAAYEIVPNGAGTATLTVTVTDEEGLSDPVSRSFEVSVIGDQIAVETLSPELTLPDVSPLTLRFPGDAQTVQAMATAPLSVGEASVAIIVRDEDGNSARERIAVDVFADPGPDSNLLTFTEFPDDIDIELSEQNENFEVTVGFEGNLDIDISAQSSERTVAVVSETSTDSGVTSGEKSAVFDIIPNRTGVTEITVGAIDRDGVASSISRSFQIEVVDGDPTPSELAPVLRLPDISPLTLSFPGEAETGTATANDENGNVGLVFDADSSAGSVVGVAIDDTSGRFTITPLSLGEAVVTISVSDPTGRSDEEDIQVNVEEVEPDPEPSAEQLYNNNCSGCHNANEPVRGNRAEWQARINRAGSIGALVNNVINGFGVMGPQGDLDVERSTLQAVVRFLIGNVEPETESPQQPENPPVPAEMAEPPVAMEDTFFFTSTTDTQQLNVLANDSDPNGDDLSIRLDDETSQLGVELRIQSNRVSYRAPDPFTIRSGWRWFFWQRRQLSFKT